MDWVTANQAPSSDNVRRKLNQLNTKIGKIDSR